MKYFKILLLSTLIGLSTFAQNEFNGGPWQNSQISDDGTEVCFHNFILGLFPSVIDTFYGVKNVCINIDHPDPTDLQIRLVSPAQTSVDLAINDGSPYVADFNNICFDMEALLNVAGVTTGFSDLELIPRGNLGNFNNGQIAEGLWQLCITDTDPGTFGVINSWSMTLDENDNMPDIGFIEFPVCNTNCTIGCECQDSSQDNCLLLPDIVISKNIMEQELIESEDTIRVSTSTTNLGYGTIEFIGTDEWFCDSIPWQATVVCPDGSLPKQRIDQRIYKKAGEECIDWIDVTSSFMQHHIAQGHNHPHIDNWVQNSIRIKGRDTLNPLSWPIIRIGSKISFCVENSIPCSNSTTSYCDYDGYNYDMDLDLVNGRMGQNYGCDNIIQGISVGYSDYYGSLLAGQEITNIDNLCNGKYYLVGHFDPDSVFVELDKSNNVTSIPINLTKQQDNCCVSNFEEIVASNDGLIYEFNDLTQPIPSSWTWDFGDGNYSNAQFPVHTYAAAGTYQVSLTTENDSSCVNSYSKSVTVVFSTDVTNTITKPSKISLYPNPFDDFSSLNMSLDKTSLVNVDLYNVLNQKIKTIHQDGFLNEGNHSFEIHVEENGIYFIKVKIDSKISIHKIVKLSKGF